MIIEYDKLIRDRIPEIISETGKEYFVRAMEEREYKKALLMKLVEESQEALEAEDHKLIIELADILEVMDAVIDVNKISKDRLEAIKEKRRNNRGGFEKRLKLLWVEEEKT